jgi:hypothetical protein
VKTRTTTGVSDIKAIEIECQNCRARYSRPVDRWQSNLLICSVCDTSLMTLNSGDSTLLEHLAAALGALTNGAGAASRPYKIRLEMEE